MKMTAETAVRWEGSNGFPNAYVNVWKAEGQYEDRRVQKVH